MIRCYLCPDQSQGGAAVNNETAAVNGGAGAGNRPEAAGQTGGQYAVVDGSKQEDTEYTKKMKADFGYFAPVLLLYSVFYTFCMYKNHSGITFPFFVAGSFLCMYLCFSRLGIILRKGSFFYMAGMLLLAISTFMTDDSRIISINKLGILLLMISLLLSQVYDTGKWQLGKYLKSILIVCFASLGELGRPFMDFAQLHKYGGKSKSKGIFYVVAGLAAALPLFLVVLALLLSADAVFREMADKLMKTVALDDFILMPLITLLMFFAGYCMLAYLCRKRIPEEVPDKRKGEPLLAITVTSLLSLLYLVFSGIQIVYLFLGQLQLPAGYSYAEYAREGFFQLLLVSLLNLVIVLVALNYFKESRVLKGVLAVMSLCTLVMIVSSGLRMVIYIQRYYLTFLRIFVLWTLAVLFLLFIGVIINIFKEGFPLFKYGVLTVTLCYAVLSFAHPDYLIARVNLAAIDAASGDSFFTAKEYQDYSYLSSLSADAAPAILPWLEQQGSELAAPQKESDYPGAARNTREYFGYYYIRSLKEKQENTGLRSFNLSRSRAAGYLNDY